MEPAYLAVALLVLGLTLIVCEVFIPSAGLIAAFATLCFAGSVVAAWTAWWYDKPGYFAIYAIALLVLIPSAFSGALYLLPRTEFGRQVLLEAPALDEVTPYQEEQRQLQRLVGQIGKTLTLLNPGGWCWSTARGSIVKARAPARSGSARGNRRRERQSRRRPAGRAVRRRNGSRLEPRRPRGRERRLTLTCRKAKPPSRYTIYARIR